MTSASGSMLGGDCGVPDRGAVVADSTQLAPEPRETLLEWKLLPFLLPLALLPTLTLLLQLAVRDVALLAILEALEALEAALLRRLPWLLGLPGLPRLWLLLHLLPRLPRSASWSLTKWRLLRTSAACPVAKVLQLPSEWALETPLETLLETTLETPLETAPLLRLLSRLLPSASSSKAERALGVSGDSCAACSSDPLPDSGTRAVMADSSGRHSSCRPLCCDTAGISLLGEALPRPGSGGAVLPTVTASPCHKGCKHVTTQHTRRSACLAHQGLQGHTTGTCSSAR